MRVTVYADTPCLYGFCLSRRLFHMTSWQSSCTSCWSLRWVFHFHHFLSCYQMLAGLGSKGLFLVECVEQGTELCGPPLFWRLHRSLFLLTG
jgi:hypothetical protein